MTSDDNKEKKLVSKFPKDAQIQKPEQCECGYLPFVHGEDIHLYRTNEELIRDFETRIEARKHPAKFRKAIVLELKCKICGQSEKSEYYRISYDEAGYQIHDFEPEIIEEWRCPNHRDSIAIETLSDHKK
jgi:hypothetical protein